VLETRKRVLGIEHPDTLTSMNNLALTWKDQGRDEEAFDMMKSVVQLRRKVLGADHPYSIGSAEVLAEWQESQ